MSATVIRFKNATRKYLKFLVLNYQRWNDASVELHIRTDLHGAQRALRWDRANNL